MWMAILEQERSCTWKHSGSESQEVVVWSEQLASPCGEEETLVNYEMNEKDSCARHGSGPVWMYNIGNLGTSIARTRNFTHNNKITLSGISHPVYISINVSSCSRYLSSFRKSYHS